MFLGSAMPTTLVGSQRGFGLVEDPLELGSRAGRDRLHLAHEFVGTSVAQEVGEFPLAVGIGR